jgi:hypothetical protein
MTNSKQQTGVEWLYNNLKSHFECDGDLLEAVQMSYEQAKEMEKERLINAHIDGQSSSMWGETADEWYNKTYGNDKQ